MIFFILSTLGLTLTLSSLGYVAGYMVPALVTGEPASLFDLSLIELITQKFRWAALAFWLGVALILIAFIIGVPA